METEIRIYFQNPFDSLQVVGIQADKNSTTATLRNKEGNADKSRKPQRVRPHWFSESHAAKNKPKTTRDLAYQRVADYIEMKTSLAEKKMALFEKLLSKQ